MAINKDKLRLNAQKYLQRGQLDKAIKELQRLVDEDPRDVRTILKIGDLQARKGDTGAAVLSYSHVAQFHTEQGFFLKSVAVYKQILKISPDDLDINRKLGELYCQLNLHSDAIQQYQRLVELHTSQNQTSEAIAALRVIADLDPLNIRLRLTLAQTQSQHGFVDEAKQQLSALAQELKGLQRFGDYAQVAEGLLKLAPSDLGTAHDLAQTYLEHSEPKRALATLHSCFRINPRDPTTLSLLITSFRALEQPEKALFLLRELAKIQRDAQDQSAYHATLRTILTLQPNDPEACAELGQSPPAAPTAPANPSFSMQSLAYAQAPDVPVSAAADDVPVTVDAAPATPHALPTPTPATLGTEAHVTAPAVIEEPEDVAAAQETIVAEIALDMDDGEEIPNHAVVATVTPTTTPTTPSTAGPTAMGDDPILLSKLLRQVDVYRKYNLHDKALETLQTLRTHIAGHAERQAEHRDTLCALCRLAAEAETYFNTWYGSTRGHETPAPTPAAPVRQPASVTSEHEDTRITDTAHAHNPSENDDLLTDVLSTTPHRAHTVPQRRPESDPTIGHVRATPAVQFADADLADGSVNMADLADEITEELDTSIMRPSGDFQVPMETVLTAFKQGIAATIDASDAETQYNLGLAYKDMGLLDEAIDAFQLACGAAGASSERHVAALTMLGQCHEEKGDFERALGCFSRALQCSDLTPAQTAALYYEMGRIYDARQRYHDAVDAFRRVYDLDPHFRDVALKLCHTEERLDAQK